jgi:hypothetical protein
MSARLNTNGSAALPDLSRSLALSNRAAQPFSSGAIRTEKINHRKVINMPEYEQGLAGLVFSDGIYDFKCVDAGEKESKETRNTMIEMQLDVFNADFTNKVRVVDRLVFVPNSYWKIDAFRRATGEKIAEDKKVSFEAEDCIDRVGRCRLRTSVYNGKARNEIDYYVEPDEKDQSASVRAPAAAQPAAKGAVPTPAQKF